MQVIWHFLTVTWIVGCQAVDWGSVRRITEPKLLLEHLTDVEIENEEFPLASKGDGRIVGGREAEPHQYPYQVGMVIESPEGMHFCGGSLLTTKWVLTAAHCAEGATKFNVILGAHKIREKEPSQQRFVATEKRVHPDWDNVSAANDIALIPLPEPAKLNEYVQLTRLPTSNSSGEALWNKKATMTGWGKPSDSAESISPTLQVVETRIVSNTYCNFRYAFLIVRDTNICASGWGGASTCNGDSGGPLVVQDDSGVPTQVGITSFGVGLGCEKYWPPAFTRVSSYLDWIHQETQDNATGK